MFHELIEHLQPLIDIFPLEIKFAVKNTLVLVEKLTIIIVTEAYVVHDAGRLHTLHHEGYVLVLEVIEALEPLFEFAEGVFHQTTGAVEVTVELFLFGGEVVGDGEWRHQPRERGVRIVA